MRSWAALFHHTTETHASKGAIGERKRWLRGTGRRIQNTKIIIAASESLKLMSTHLPRQLLWSEHRDIWEITYACEDTHMRVQTMTMRNPGRQAGSYINDNDEDCVCSTLFIILLVVLQKRGSSDPVLVVVSVSALITDRWIRTRTLRRRRRKEDE